jgi:hypothetical protein
MNDRHPIITQQLFDVRQRELERKAAERHIMKSLQSSDRPSPTLRLRHSIGRLFISVGERLSTAERQRDSAAAEEALALRLAR